MKPRQVFRSYDGTEVPWAVENHYCPRCGERFLPEKKKSGTRARKSGSTVAPLRCPVCGFTVYKNPFPGVVVLIERRGKVLLCRRSEASFQPGKWCLPGGFMEYDEDFLSAGIRETREETGLEIGVDSIVSVVTNYLTPKLHTLVIVLLAHVKGGRARPGDDAEALAWVGLSDALPDMAFEADRHIITRYAEAPFAGAPVDPRYAAKAGGRRRTP
jgi:8-oxo-dGTP diphosphatase